MLARLDALDAALRGSPLFPRHEFIGSTLLFVADASGDVGASVWMIDFAGTIAHDGCVLSHETAWELGNHEDGYLIGLGNLRRLWRQLLDEDDWGACSGGLEEEEPAAAAAAEQEQAS